MKLFTGILAGLALGLGSGGAMAGEQPGVSVIPNQSVEVFYSGGYYWTRRDGGWYRTHDHNGSWARIDDRQVPMVIARASEFGKTGTEQPKDLRNDEVFFAALKKLWIEAGLKMGLTTKGRPMTADELANSETIPKVCIVGPPMNGGNISTRYFTPQTGHDTMAVTGGCCLAAACLMPGTVAYELAQGLPALSASGSEAQVDIENPAGILSATIEGRQTNTETLITRAAYKRSAQILLRGYVPVYRASTALKEALREAARVTA